MQWLPWISRRKALEAGERARRLHSAWLSAALASGRSYPRIPSRPVERGGFDALRHRPTGPERAERWWSLALERVERDPPDTRP